MTRIALQHDAVNLAQGFPDFPVPDRAQGGRLRRHPRGHQPVRDHLGRQGLPRRHRRQDAALLPVLVGRSADEHHGHLRRDRGDDRVDAGAASIRATRSSSSSRSTRTTGRTRSCQRSRAALRDAARARPMSQPSWWFDPDELRAAFGPRTRGLVLNTPHNPTGKVFTRDELAQIAELCIEHDTIVFTDDIYEHILYAGEHIPIATLPGMAERTVAINSLSKTYSVTGWRVGWVIAPRRAHLRHPQGARLPDRRRGRAAAGGRRRGARPARFVLRRACRALPRAPRRAGGSRCASRASACSCPTAPTT